MVGHLYFFLMFKYPQDFGGASLLSTPQFLYNLFPNRAGGMYGNAPSSGQQAGGGDGGGGGGGGGGAGARFRGLWGGQGNRLGNN